MTPILLPLYFFAFASISLLGLFARRNKRMGWVKPRPAFLEDLRALQQAWEEEDSENQAVRVSTPPAGALESFTSQLARLDGALKHNTASPVTAQATEETIEPAAMQR